MATERTYPQTAPGNIPASDTANKTVTKSGGHVTETIIRKKLTPGGADGLVTLVDGKEVSHVKPT